MDLLRISLHHHCIAPPPFLRSSGSRGFHHQNPYRKKTTTAVASYKRRPVVVPARDRVIEFGKHKGKMMGTLPSEYLRWISNNLRAGDFEEWANLADQVLGDEVYKDRMEWEQAWMLLSGDDQRRRSAEGVAGEIEGLGERFGWDNDDKVGWSNVNFGLLGTSNGGRIPRIGGNKPTAAATSRNKSGGKGSIERERRRERMRKKREEQQEKEATVTMGFDGKSGGGGGEQEHRREAAAPEELMDERMRSPFPGRQSLVNKSSHHPKTNYRRFKKSTSIDVASKFQLLHRFRICI